MKLGSVKAYEVLSEEYIEELKSDAYILRHRKTGARIVLLSNDDENKVFYIGFRTPPAESTGVMHILEHSVLCGSKNFPVKDPFIELAKGSLNTFLNAMTYPDKTVYPVASCNDKDFANLMHVYLDAVFYPNILNNDYIFRQEGWHYDLNDPEDELTINGVVYNEMKGAFSAPESVFQREIFNSLFPDTEYSEESGGDPKVIPELTYEHFIEVYKQYYHPSNSYIYLYGDMDMVERLEFLDKEYLGNFDAIEIDSKIRLQKPFGEPRRVCKEFSITDSEPLEDNSYLSINWAMESNLDREQYIAMQVIDYCLGSSQGAVIKEALLNAGIGKDVYTYYDNGVRQPYFSVVAKNANEADEERFIALVRDELESIIAKGLDKDTLRAGLNGLEFRYREADFGSYPPGLMYGLQALDSWLYDDDKPFIHVAASDTFKSLRAAIDTDYYEKLIEKYMLNNSHSSVVKVIPKRNLVDMEEAELKSKLASIKASMSEEEKNRIVDETKRLLEFQNSEDTPENLAKIPVLSIGDIKKKAFEPSYKLKEIGGCICVNHDLYTKGIDYIKLLFDVTDLGEDELRLLGLLSAVFGMTDTQESTYAQLYNKIYIQTGGISTTTSVYPNHRQDGKYKVTLEIRAKCLSGDIDNVYDIIEEIILTSKLKDTKRLKTVLDELKSHLSNYMLQAGHQVASLRASSYYSAKSRISDLLTGFESFKAVESILLGSDDALSKFADDIAVLFEKVFVKKRLLFDFAGEETEYNHFCQRSEEFLGKLPDGNLGEAPSKITVEKHNEGITSSSQVQFVCRSGNYRSAGFDYTGALKVLKVIMGYEYLWMNIRVKGGAYGCMSNFGRSGESFFVSYRDPNLKETVDIYKGIGDYLRAFNVDERAMTQYIIGAISEMDTPLTPSGVAKRDLICYLTGIEGADAQKERDEVLSTDVEAIRALAPLVDAIINENAFCVVGNESKINANKDMFGEIVSMFNS